MKPKIFIGSSREAERIALAIHSQLHREAECTPWTAGAFGLNEQAVEALTRNLRESDYGIFVFAADDVANIRGDLLTVPRDNVVFEAGLFSGYLGSRRCFIVIPSDTTIHVPSDLFGLTLGRYEDRRTDKNWEAAVSTFCQDVKTRITQDGLFTGHPYEDLRELSTLYECCDWVETEEVRVKRKKEISLRIDTFCQHNVLNKHRLLSRQRTGHYLALFSAIKFRPEPGDWNLIQSVDRGKLAPGFAYFKLMDAVEELRKPTISTLVNSSYYTNGSLACGHLLIQ